MTYACMVTGGRWHDAVGFIAHCQGWLLRTGFIPRQADLAAWEPDPADGLVVLWTCHDQPDEVIAGKLERLVAWVADGGVVLAVHGGSVAAAWHVGWREVLGAAFIRHPAAGALQWIPCQGDGNPLADVPAAAWHDEPYRHTEVSPDAEVLLTYTDGEGSHPAIWLRRHGSGVVGYFSAGHDRRAWESTAFQRLFGKLVRHLMAMSAGAPCRS